MEGQAPTGGTLWRWEPWQGDGAILLSQANSNLFCRGRGEKMDLLSVYPLSQLPSPRQPEEGEKVPRFVWKLREGLAFKKQTLKYLFQLLHQEYGK